MAWHKAGDLLADDSAEDLQEVLPGAPKRKFGLRAWLALATASSALVGVGLVQMGAFAPSHGDSVLARMSEIHGTIHAIVKDAIEEGKFQTKLELVINDYSKRDSPPAAMTIHSNAKVGGEGKWPKTIVTFASKNGKANDLKAKLEKVFEALLKVAPRREVDEIKKAVTFSVGTGDSVLVEVVPPKNKVDKHEIAELKAAIKEHKLDQHAYLDFGRDFEGIHAFHDKNIALAIGGIAAKFDSTFASSIFKMLTPVYPQAQSLKALRMIRSRNEVFYSSEEELLKALPPLPPTHRVVEEACSRLPGGVAGALQGIDALMAGVSNVVEEGLPYDMEVVTDLTNFNPAPILAEHCAMTP